MRLPADLMFGRALEGADDYPEYVSELRESLENAHELAISQIGTAQYRRKEYYDRRKGGPPYAAGDRVWLQNPAIKKGQSDKLHSPWMDPFVVVDCISYLTYGIQPEGGLARKRQTVHFNRLKLCYARPAAETDGNKAVDVGLEPDPFTERRPNATMHF